MFKDIALHFIKSTQGQKMILGLIVTLVSQGLSHYGIVLQVDQTGLLNDLVSAAGLAAMVSAHVKVAMPQIQANKDAGVSQATVAPKVTPPA